LFFELKSLEDKYPELKTSDSPTVRVGGNVLDKFSKVLHKEKMKSLNDVKTKEEMKDWVLRISKLLTTNSKLDFYCEYKFDGLSASVVYNNGKFILGATRGDGSVGEDVTENMKTIKTVPLNLPENLDVEIRGEIILSKKEFEKVNKEQEKLGLPLYANPRNLAAGSIRQLDPKITASRHLEFVAYKLVTDLGQKTHEEEHKIIEKLGFKTFNQNNKYCKDLDEVFEYYDEIEKKRDDFLFEIDGIVVNINDNKTFNLLGDIGKGPRGGIAFKFKAMEAITEVLDIEVQVGRTGILTPVAFVKPVLIGGARVSRCTLHNKEEIKRLGLKIGDHVLLIRAGDVIPKIIKVLVGLRTGKEKNFKMPEICPICKNIVIEQESGVLVKCVNTKCPARSQESLRHFVAKGGFDIKGLGPRLLQKFVDEHLIVDSADLFSLEEGDLKVLEGLGEKSSKNIISALNNAKKISLEKFIVSLGIPLIGVEGARMILENLRKYGNIKTPKDVLKIASNIRTEE
jgi:DNA ligase (NAD+)